MSQDVYSKAEPEEEAAACFILCKACFVNGLGEYFKKSLTKWILEKYFGPSNTVQKK